MKMYNDDNDDQGRMIIITIENNMTRVIRSKYTYNE